MNQEVGGQKSAIRRCLCYPRNPRFNFSRGSFEIRRDSKSRCGQTESQLAGRPSFSGHTNLLVLQLALHFEPLRLDRLNDFLGFVSLEALLNF